MEYVFPDGDTTMHKMMTMSSICDLELMTFALDSIVDHSLLMQQNKAGEILLHLHIPNVTIEAFTLLFSNYSTNVLSMPNNEKDTPLHIAAIYGETEFLSLMLADLPPKKVSTLLNKRGRNNYTVIETAIDNLESEAVKFLKNQGALVTKEIVEFAKSTGHQATINALKSCNHRSKKSNNSKPIPTSTKKKRELQAAKIRHSVQSKNARLAEEFLKIITNETLEDTTKIKEIKFLFRQGLPKDHKFAGGKSLSHKVIHECRPTFLPILSQLLSDGASIETIDDDQSNLLHYTAEFFCDEAYKSLLKASRKDREGNIPALFAQNINGQTPLHIAALQGDNLFITHIKKYLPPEKFKELLGLKTKEHKTALHEAIVAGNQFSIKLLFSYGQGLNVKGNENDTLIKLAHETQNSKTIDLVTRLVANQSQQFTAHQELVVRPIQASSEIALTKKIEPQRQ